MMTISYDPAEHYDHVTAAWALLLGDELHYGVFDEGDEPLPVATDALTRRMLAAARLSPGMDVLDVGCGSGAPACKLVSELGVRVLGITTSAEGVGAATFRASTLELDDAKFAVADGTDNGLPDASFDCAWVLESSHLMRERERLISECARVLRPGGRLVLCDLIRKREIPFEEVRARRADFATLRTAFGDAHMEPLERYTSLAAAHGLEVDVVEDLTELTLPTFDRWRANAEEYRAEAVAAIGEEGVAAFERSCDILEAFWRDGTFGYGLFAATKR
jgi:27-O-demethylrifamycin SV methyltransferase